MYVQTHAHAPGQALRRVVFGFLTHSLRLDTFFSDLKAAYKARSILSSKKEAYTS